jgi:hypothetical protein
MKQEVTIFLLTGDTIQHTHETSANERTLHFDEIGVGVEDDTGTRRFFPWTVVKEVVTKSL